MKVFTNPLSQFVIERHGTFLHAYLGYDHPERDPHAVDHQLLSYAPASRTVYSRILHPIFLKSRFRICFSRRWIQIRTINPLKPFLSIIFVRIYICFEKKEEKKAILYVNICSEYFELVLYTYIFFHIFKEIKKERRTMVLFF